MDSKKNLMHNTVQQFFFKEICKLLREVLYTNVKQWIFYSIGFNKFQIALWESVVDITKQVFCQRRLNKILIKVLWQQKGYKAKKYVEDFFNRNLSLSTLNNLLKNDQTGTVDHRPSSGSETNTAQNIDAVD